MAAFFAVGAYTTAFVTAPPIEAHWGGLGLPIPLGMLAAMAAAGVLAVGVGLVTLKLRADYLAIATIGIAEIVRLVIKTETGITGGVRGFSEIPRPMDELGWIGFEPAFLVLTAAIVAAVYVALEAARRSAWGRVLRGIRDNEASVLAAGKNVLSFRVQAFVVGACVMGLAGALYAHFISFISPSAFKPMLATFLVWVMLIAGGSGSNKGALLGATVIWAIWSGSEMLTGLLPAGLASQAGAVRILLIGLVLEVILVTRPEGLLSERSEQQRAGNRS